MDVLVSYVHELCSMVSVEFLALLSYWWLQYLLDQESPMFPALYPLYSFIGLTNFSIPPAAKFPSLHAWLDCVCTTLVRSALSILGTSVPTSSMVVGKECWFFFILHDQWCIIYFFFFAVAHPWKLRNADSTVLSTLFLPFTENNKRFFSRSRYFKTTWTQSFILPLDTVLGI